MQHVFLTRELPRDLADDSLGDRFAMQSITARRRILALLSVRQRAGIYHQLLISFARV